MPKVQLSNTGKVAKYVFEFSKEHFQNYSKILYFVCEKSFAKRTL